MTPEEAIKISNDTPVEISSGSKTTTREYNQMLHLAENALEKQIAKKPNISIKGATGWNTEYHCPTCRGFISKGKCCSECGQALDWSDIE